METQEKQLELYDSFAESMGKIPQVLPEVGAALGTVRDAVYKDSALSRKFKRLIAMSVALGIGCTPCIIGQTRAAVEAGASRDEVLEAASVLLAIHGTTGYAETWRVVKVLEELGVM